MRSGRSIAKFSRGSTLLIVMIFVIISLVTNMAILYLKGQQEIIVLSEIRAAKAFNLSEAGFERMRQWVQNLNQWPEISQPLIATSNYNPFGTITLGVAGETYSTIIRKDLARSGIFKRYYNVQSDGTAGNFIKPINAVILITTNTHNQNPPFRYYVDKLAEKPTHK